MGKSSNFKKSLRNIVRRSEDVARENHIYLHYSSWAEFCAYLTCLNMKPLLEEKKVVFLFEEEIEQYPIDFKARFNRGSFQLSKDCSASARLSQPSMMSRTFATVSCTFDIMIDGIIIRLGWASKLCTR